MTALAAVLATAALILPTVSHASEFSSADGNSMSVSYADLNLASRPAQLTLERRIADAARVVCVYEDSRDIGFASQVNSCRSSAIAGAEPAYQAAVAAARRGSVTVLDAASLIVTAR
jgi:UrcA family protein